VPIRDFRIMDDFNTMIKINSPSNCHVFVGMSGGVDSSVTALLLLQQGFQVSGLFMKNWEEEDTQFECSAEEDHTDALKVCEQLSIPLHTVNFSHEYWENVFLYFIEEYKRGRTPNPDVLCNREIKFKVFLEHALSLGADYIATGHYVDTSVENNRYNLLKGIDSQKDQSYFLHLLEQYPLSKSLFPLGQYHKTQVREIAKNAGLTTSEKKDSTGICFIGERNFQKFLSQYLPAQPGDIVTDNQQVIGQHQGLMYYTLGQRKGLGIGGLNDFSEAPWFVVEKDLKNNHLIVAQGQNHSMLYSDGLWVHQIHWINEIPTLPYQCQAKIRYRQAVQDCTISHSNKCYVVNFTQPQRSVTPGQSVVFYDGEVCLGGGVIEGKR
jgi:tRNA-uridine 2-sulfurtransferase